MFAIKTAVDLNNLIALQSEVLKVALGNSNDFRISKGYSSNMDLFSHKWTMVKVPVEIDGYQGIDEQNMRLHFLRQYLRNSNSFLKTIISPFKISMTGKWIPFFVPGEFDFADAIRLTHDGENILSGISRPARIFLERSILPVFTTELMLEDIVSAIVWGKVKYNMAPESFRVDVFSASHSILYYVRKFAWHVFNPKFKKAYVNEHCTKTC